MTLLAGGFLAGGGAAGEQIPVRHPEGLVHGFLVLRSLDGTLLAHGDLIQTSRGNRVTSRLVFRFKDGSLQDETAVYTQSGKFRLISDRLIQRGPSFPHPMEMSVDAVGGRVTIKRRAEDGSEKVEDERMELPDDLANGLALTLVKNLPSNSASTAVSMVVAAPKPRLVKVIFHRAGEESFSVAGLKRKAARFIAHVEIGGLTGFVARLMGKQPPDASVWIVEGEAPGFVKSESSFFQDGPMWRIELASPVWPDKP